MKYNSKQINALAELGFDYHIKETYLGYEGYWEAETNILKHLQEHLI